MVFIGSGALLWRAVSFSKRINLSIDIVCCPQADPTASTLRAHGFPVLETNNPNSELLPILRTCGDRTAFSINNRCILDDRLLDAGVSFFNVHNGLIQQYRGLPEICIFAAICRGEQRYGATLHRILPQQQVDSGPVFAQLTFGIHDDDGFSEVLARSLTTCQAVFEINVQKILENEFSEATAEISERIYSYRDIYMICSTASSERLAKAAKLGWYAAYFPKLKSIVERYDSSSRRDSRPSVSGAE